MMQLQNEARPAPDWTGNGPRKDDRAAELVDIKISRQRTEDQDPARELLLARLRVEALRLRWAASEVDFIGCALANRMITPGYAAEQLDALYGGREVA